MDKTVDWVGNAAEFLDSSVPETVQLMLERTTTSEEWERLKSRLEVAAEYERRRHDLHVAMQLQDELDRPREALELAIERLHQDLPNVPLETVAMALTDAWAQAVKDAEAAEQEGLEPEFGIMTCVFKAACIIYANHAS